MDLTKDLLSLSEYWLANPNIWFNCTPEEDQYITKRFGHLLFLQPDLLLSLDQPFSCILLYDQISRHVKRTSIISPEQERMFSNIAIRLTETLLPEFDSMEPVKKVFTLMPFRHSGQLDRLEFCLAKIKSEKEEHPLYLRFLRATILGMSKIKSKNLRPIDLEPIELTTYGTLITSIPNCLFSGKDLRSEKLFSVMKSMAKEFPKTIVLSLSGGVDSMVCSYLLADLLPDGSTLKTVTINYNNRPEAKEEAYFVNCWVRYLGTIYPNISFESYIREINELQRDRSHHRDLYESVTREIRFDAYRTIAGSSRDTAYRTIAGSGRDTTTHEESTSSVPVILGHNLDDCLENIINNIKKGRSLGNLRGMSPIMVVDGVTLVRPLLDISKSEIIDFANRYRIPHLPNSTPTWSERGQIRDRLLPFISSFDPAIIPGLLQLANTYQDVYSIYSDSMNSFISENSSLDFVITKESQKTFLFWKEVFTRLAASGRMKEFPSNKSILSLCSRLQNCHYGEIRLTKNLGIHYLSSDGKECLTFENPKIIHAHQAVQTHHAIEPHSWLPEIFLVCLVGFCMMLNILVCLLNSQKNNPHLRM